MIGAPGRHACASVLLLAAAAAAGCGPEIVTHERDGLSIHFVAAGIGNVWIVDVASGGTLIVDTSTKGDGDTILRALDELGIAKNAVDLVAITHGHLDHAGAGKQMQDELSAPIAIHEGDADQARAGRSAGPIPQTLDGAIVAPFLDLNYPAFEPDLLFSADQRLDAFGIPGEVVHLPAHSPGSIAVVLDTGDAFVGDIVRGADEGARGEHEGRCDTHAFTEDHEGDRAAMEKLVARGVKLFMPGHGPLFDRDSVRGWLEDTQTESDARERATDVEPQ